MTLRDQIRNVPETLADFDAACRLRWREGDRLFVEQELDGATYLLGYAIEMRLKFVAFRLVGGKLFDPVTPQRKKVATWMKQNAPQIDAENGHSLLYWCSFIQLFRPLTAKQVPWAAVRGLRRHVLAKAYPSWQVDMRYRPCNCGPEETWHLWSAVWWIEENWIRLL